MMNLTDVVANVKNQLFMIVGDEAEDVNNDKIGGSSRRK